MRKIYSVLAGAALLGSAGATAQQLPNVGFGEWKEACGSTEAFGYSEGMRQRPGVEPEGWNGSSVNQNVLLTVTQELIYKVDREENDPAVRMVNAFVGMFGIGSVAPGFINFGTPWVQAEMDVNNCDGGTYGGLDFTYRPDELQLDVKRVDQNEEVSSVIAYLWNGEFSSMVGGLSAPSNPRTDVDRAVMGREGVEILEGSNGKLIASIDHTLTSTDGEWQTLTLPFSYVNDETPEKLNVIVCSGDYWNRGNLLKDTELLTDNIKLIYHSRLASLDVFHAPLEGFDPETYEYEIDAFIPETDEIFVEGIADGHNATVDTAIDYENAVITLTVSNVGEDNDGLTEHVYTLQFKSAAETEETVFDGKLTIEMFGSFLTPEGGMDATIIIESTPGSDICTITLPNFALDLGDGPAPLGDIVVTGVVKTTDEAGKITYNGSVDDFELLDGELVADITLTGEQDGDEIATFDITVLWSGIEILCHFSATPSAISTVISDNDTETVIYDLKGIRVNGENLPAGVYIRRQGNEAKKFVVK